jgi:hypothetical protein
MLCGNAEGTFMATDICTKILRETGSVDVVDVVGTVHVFRQKLKLEDAIGSHTCSLEANMRVTNGIPLCCQLTPLTNWHRKFHRNTEGRMRDDRGGLVQHDAQLKYLHATVTEYAAKYGHDEVNEIVVDASVGTLRIGHTTVNFAALEGDTLMSLDEFVAQGGNKELFYAIDTSGDARCAFFDRNLHSRMPLVPTPARLKRAGV